MRSHRHDSRRRGTAPVRLLVATAVVLGTALPAGAEVVQPTPHGAVELRRTAAYLRGHAVHFRKAYADKHRITDKAWLARVRHNVDAACAMTKSLGRWADALPNEARYAYKQCAYTGSDVGKGCFAKIEADLGFGGVANYGMFADELDASGRALDKLAGCLNVPSQAQQQADQQQQARERAEEQKRQQDEAKRLQEEQQRQREEAERQQREEEKRIQREQDQREQDRRDEEEQRRLDDAARDQPGASGSQRTGGGGGPSTASSTARRVKVPRDQSATMATATTAALVGGAAMMGLGATMNVEDGITPFEINVAAQFGVARGGLMVGGGLELRLLRWGESKLRPGESLRQAQRRLRGFEVFAVGQIGGLFDSWMDCQPAPCRSITEGGRVVYGELGARYWQRWYGVGLVLSHLGEDVTARTAMLDGEEPEDRVDNGASLELLAAPLGRGARKVMMYGGLRLNPSGIGALWHMGVNRMLINLDVMASDVGFLFTVGMGMRFAL